MRAFMERAWKAIPDSRSFQGIAALLTIITIVLAWLVWLYSPFKGPDVVVQVIPQSSTIPLDLLQASREAAKASLDFVNSLDGVTRDRNIRRLRSKLKTPVMQRFLAQTSMPPLDKLHIIIRNDSDHDISNVRLLVTGVSMIWSCSAGGKFVSAPEAKSYNEQLMDLRRNESLSAYEGFTLPPLPTLTAGGVLDIQFTGHVSDVKVVPTQGVPCIVQTPSKTWVWDDTPNVAAMKFLLKNFGPVVLAILLILYFWSLQGRRVRQRAKMYREKSEQLAAEATQQQKPDMAVWLLECASHQPGFDADKIKKDPAFSSLHTNAEFKKLILEPSPLLRFGTS